MLRLAGKEIEELKDSLRYAEFQLAKTKEEREQAEDELQNQVMAHKVTWLH